MKLLFTLITISIISTTLSATKCKNPELKCIELCCNVTQYYNDKYEYCENIPEVAKASWHALLHDNKTMEFVEYGECESFGDSVITTCLSPYYNSESKQLVLRRWLNVPCNRLDEIVFVWPAGVIIYFCVVPFCLPIMVVYTCIKASKGKFVFHLVSWYLASMALALLAEGAASIDDLVALSFIDQLMLFFFISTCLWLNVIGHQLWSGFSVLKTSDYAENSRRRFMWYSLYVWGIAAIITGIDDMLSGGQWNLNVGFGSKCLIAIYNVVTFLMLSVHISLTYYKIVKATRQVRFKRKLLYILCRLCLMMGIPRMLVMISKLFTKVDTVTGFIITIQEPFVIFIVLVLKPKKVFNWILSGCRSSQKPKKIVNTVEFKIKDAETIQMSDLKEFTIEN